MRSDVAVQSRLPLGQFADAWDCHVHLFGNRREFPQQADRRYTPGEAAPGQLQRHLDRLGAKHCVIVQASIYGDDNACLFAGMDQLSPNARAVISLSADRLQDHTITDLTRRGVRGARINHHGKITTLSAARAVIADSAKALDGTGWHVEINCEPDLVEPILEACGPCSTPLVFDHLFGLDPSATTFDPDVQSALRAGGDKRVWAKVSGLDRMGPLDARDAWSFRTVQELCACMSDRLVWGSDWPHTPLAKGEQPFRQVDLDRAIEWLLPQLGDFSAQIFRHNPERLYA